MVGTLLRILTMGGQEIFLAPPLASYMYTSADTGDGGRGKRDISSEMYFIYLVALLEAGQAAAQIKGDMKDCSSDVMNLTPRSIIMKFIA